MEEQPLLEKRKETFLNLLKKKNFIIYIVLLVIIIMGVAIRAQPLENFKDATTGKYISMELDSEIFLRYAKYINEHGTLYKVDSMRNHPLGGSLEYIGLFTSYFVAYLYKFIHVFVPSITIEYVDIIYPLIATAITTLFLFLLLKKIFNWKVGLLACLFLNLSPPFLFRSISSDHDILVMMFSIMAMYIYVKAIEQKKLLKGIAFGGLAGIITFLGIWSGGAAYIVLTVLGFYTLINLFLNKLKKIHYATYLSWIIVFSLFLEIGGIAGGIQNFIIMMMTFPAYFALLAIVINFTIFKIKWKSEKIKLLTHKLKEKLPEGFVSIVISFILIFVFLFAFLKQNLIFDLINQLIDIVLKSGISSRWASTVAENKRPYVIDFFNQFGRIYMLAVLGGAIILFYKLIKPIKKYWRSLTIGFSIFLILYFFSRTSPNSILNGTNLFSRVIFFGSIILFSIYLIYFYFKIYKDKTEYDNIKKLNEKYIIILVWFFVMIVGALSAIRFSFEFAPITTILASFCFIEIFEYLRSLKINWIKICGLIILGLILFSPFSFAQGIVVKHYNTVKANAKYSGLGYNYQWQLAGKWVRENTPKDSIFVHWWDYGYWVQSGFERTTVTDGGNFIVWWNYLTGRYVLTAQTFEEPLKFLYAHDVDYLLIVNDEIGKYPAFSLIGSNENYDRFASIPLLVQDPRTQETRNETIYFYQGSFLLKEDLIYNNELFPKDSAIIGGIFLPVKEEVTNESKIELNVGQPQAAIVYNNKRVDVPLKCVFFNGEKKEFENGLNNCLMLVPFVQGNIVNPVGGAYYLFENVKDTLFTKLYLFDEDNDYFKKVYSDINQVPLMIYNGRSIGPIKIWKVNYPEGIVLSSKEKDFYLRMDYPDEKLLVL